MKAIRKLTGILRIAGVVLIIASLVLGLYSLASNSGAWNSFEDAVRRKKTDPGPGRQDETAGNE